MPTHVAPSLADPDQLYLLQQAVHATRGALIITDCNQKDDPIIYANPAFLELTGYDEDEIVGFNCRFLQGEDTDPKIITKLRNAVKQRKEIRVTVKNYRKDGTMFWNDLLMSPVKNAQGEVTHFIGMQLDITERVEYANALEISEQKLRRSNQELEQFTYAASHDLQEPLRMIRSFMQLVEQRYADKLDNDGRSFINYAVEGATRMQTLVNDLLLLSRVRTKAKPVASVPMGEALEDSLNNLRERIAETKADIKYPNDLPSVLADRVQLVQLLQNLISNGIKYRQAGKKPIIKLSVTYHDAMCEVAIADNGIGIQEEYFDRIFGVFQRLHTREEYEGNGVGLAICCKIVERQGGTMRLESTVGKGSTFYFTMPLAKKATS